MLRFANKQDARWLKVRDVEKSTPQKSVEKRDPGRVTQVIDMYKRQEFLNDTVRRALVEVAASKFGASDFFETPYMLRYKVGGKYHEHADSESFDPERGLFYRVADRDVSLLIYLNDDFEGGELSFKRLNYTYRPKTGDLVLFPSSNLYMHQAEIITKGSKFALVSWSCLKASRKLFHGGSRWPPIKI